MCPSHPLQNQRGCSKSFDEGHPFETRFYEINVARAEGGRGGSVFLHDRVQEGDTLRIGAPTNLFGLNLRATHHLMIAGGIGITPFLAQIRQLARMGGSFALHYAVKTSADALPGLHAGTHLHISDAGSRMEIAALLQRQPIGTQVYICGPERLIASVRGEALALGWPPSAILSEAFTAPPTGAPFTVHLARSNRAVHVPAHQSLLEALEEAGVAAPWLCRGGACGQCETRVRSCKGEIAHHDHVLTPAERAQNHKSCSVSRGSRARSWFLIFRSRR